MAGIYIHVPFCKKKCVYCDFFSIGALDKISQYPIIIDKELQLRREFITEKNIETIYFGGGTPSLLSPIQIEKILNSFTKTFSISSNPEITLEANPDDLTKEILIGYRNVGINRLSIGIQSFNDNELTFLGRRHNALAAEKSVEIAQEIGFENISIDLIYGIPESTIESWHYSLSKAFSLGVKHLSCYHLTYEEKTVLAKKLKQKQFNEIDELLSINQFNLLRDFALQNGYVHYEVSNLVKDGFYSRHNTAYWKGISYLGLGPAAHSYNGSKREWNPNSYVEWQKGIENGIPNVQGEVLDEQTQFNEIILTRLRTIWGINLIELKNRFGKKMVDRLLLNANKYLQEKKLIIRDNHLKIPSEEYFISDGIISDLIIVD